MIYTEIASLIILSWLGTLLMRQYAMTKGIVDQPNQRSAHQTVTPRAGGLGFILVFLSWCVAYVLQASISHEASEMLMFIATGTIVALIGFLDDKYQLSAVLRLTIQVILAVLVGYFFVIKFVNPWWGMSFGIHMMLWAILIISSINFYNFMDGSDAFSSIQGFFVFGFLGALAYYLGEPNIAKWAWALCLTLVGFLYWNWPKAKIFMGDVGSAFLGFSAIFMTFWLELKTQSAVIPMLMVYGIFWFDPTLTLLRLCYLKDNITMAHNQHAYQRFLQIGYSKKQLLVCQIILNTLLMSFAILTVIYAQYQLIWGAIAGGLLCLSYRWVEKRNPQVPYPGR